MLIRLVNIFSDRPSKLSSKSETLNCIYTIEE